MLSVDSQGEVTEVFCKSVNESIQAPLPPQPFPFFVRITLPYQRGLHRRRGGKRPALEQALFGPRHRAVFPTASAAEW